MLGRLLVRIITAISFVVATTLVLSVLMMVVGEKSDAQQGCITGVSAGPCTYVQTVPLTVATLPTCNAALEGARAYVTDQNTAVAYRGAVTGVGTTRQAVLCSNAAWIQD